MVANILNILTKAISERRCIAIRYHDQRQVRVVEPHAIYSGDRGELILDGYQIRGYSSSGRPVPFWRPFRVKRITAISLLREGFSPRVSEGYSSSRLKYKNGLIAAVKVEEQPAFVYPIKAEEMGPFLPEGIRRH